MLDDGFEVAADFGAVFGAGLGGLGDGDDAAIAPCGGGQGDQGLGEVGGAQLHLLAAGGLGAEHGSLADGAAVGVGQGDAQVEGVGVDGEKGIGPGGGLLHIHIHAFGGQGDEGEGGALAVEEVGGGLGSGLGLALGVDRVLGDAGDGLLFAVAGGEGHGQEQGHGRKSLES